MKKILLTFFIFLFSVQAFSEKELSEQAWEKSAGVIQKIMKHPFNIELMDGDLDKTTFGYYIEQDDLYLQEYARCLAMISTKLEAKYAALFLKYADEVLQIEQNQLHKYFHDALPIKKTGRIAPATLTYTNYLLRTCAIEPVEVAVAAILPCFWIYREVGLSLAKGARPNNRYQRWIEAYSNKEFNEEVDKVIAIFNTLANNTTTTIRKKMIEAFYTSTLLEWYFWDDSYNKRIFENI